MMLAANTVGVVNVALRAISGEVCAQEIVQFFSVHY